jgi:hypothetical protein
VEHVKSEVADVNGHRIWVEDIFSPYSKPRGTLRCTCGEYKDRVRITARDKPYQRDLNHFLLHAKDLTPPIPRPLLVGTIPKQRVDNNKIWVFHLNHDWPSPLTGRTWLASNEKWAREQPFFVVRETSVGWNLLWQYDTLDRAKLEAARLVTREKGTVLEEFSLETGVVAAPSTVITAAAELVTKHKPTTTSSSLKRAIKELDAAIDTVYSLQELRNELAARLKQQLGLDILEG